MAEYRKAAREEKSAIVDFINMVFSVAHEPHNFKTLLPKVYGDEACFWADHYIARDHGRVEGAVALLEERWSVLGEELKVGVVGSVSTHPYARGAGHMKKCMGMMLEDAAARGLDLLFLGGKRQRYEYFGFSQGGVGTCMRLAPDNFRHAWGKVDISGISFAKLGPWTARAKALYDAQPVRALRREEEFALVASSWNDRPWAVLREGEFLGYLVASQEGDEITELGLVREADCPAILRAWHEAHDRRTVSVDVPVWDRERLLTLARVAAARDQGAAEMFRVLDFPRLTRLFLAVKSRYARLADGRFVLQVEDEAPFAVEVREGKATVARTDEAPDAHLGRLEAQDLLLAPLRCVDTSGMPACVENWFPLPVTVFSADGF